MASLVCPRKGSGRSMYILVMVDDERKSVTLTGSAHNKKQGEAICLRVETLAAAFHSHQPIDTETAKWLASIGDKLHNALAKIGLVEPRTKDAKPVEQPPTLGKLAETFLAAKGKLEASSVVRLEHELEKLKSKYGADRTLSSFTTGCAVEYEGWLAKQGLSESSQRTSARYAKQAFQFAVDKQWIEKNPFQKLKASSLPAQRTHYVDPAQAVSILEGIAKHFKEDESLSIQWQVLFGLARYAGLRVPSESHKIEWAHVDWDSKALIVPCKKTRRYAETRPVPIIPELMPLLRAAHAMANGSETIITLSRHNLGRTFPAILESAGFTVWDDLYQTLRRSCETHLVSMGYETHAVAQWLGHSERVSKDHYLMVTAEVFKRATQMRANSRAECSGSKRNEAATLGNAIGAVLAEVPTEVRENAVFPSETLVVRGGIEPPTHGFSIHCSTD